jgi:hypothetical protein
MHGMQKESWGLGEKPKPKGITHNAWAKELIHSQFVIYLVGVLVQLELLLQLVTRWLYLTLS